MSNKMERFLTVKEVADWFGVNPMTIYRKVRAGEIPALKFGKGWLFPEELLREWIKAQTRGGEGKPKNLLQGVVPDFSSVPEVQLVYFFGSSASGLSTPLSDIDIAYLDDGKISPFDLEPRLENLILSILPNAPRIDLVNLRRAPVALQYRIIRDGRLIYEISGEARASFEEYVFNHYLDYAPVLNLFYNDAYKNLKEAA